MKRIIFILSIFMITISCNSLSTSEKSIQEYMRTQTGSPDLEIEFTNVQITKQTVGDSIDILQKIFEEQIKAVSYTHLLILQLFPCGIPIGLYIRFILYCIRILTPT